MKAAIYARVSTVDQEPENQLQELRRYVEARGWTGIEFVDRGVSGSKDRSVHFVETGFGLNARAGFAFALPGDHHALLLGVDGFGSQFDKASTVAVALNLGWQFF